MLRLAELRKSRGLTMKEVAQALKIPYTSYVNYEKGEREPSIDKLIFIADFYKISLDYLMGRTSKITDDNPSADEYSDKKSYMDSLPLPLIVPLQKIVIKLNRKGQEDLIKYGEFLCTRQEYLLHF